MVLDDAGRCVETVRTWRSAPRKRYAVERHPEGFFRRHRDWAVDAALVLAEAFAVDPLRRVALETDVLACVSRRDCTILLLRDDGEPVAVARRATTDGGSYLSSIGTRPAWRGRGLGSLITALAVVDAIDAGSDMVHLAVDATNESGRRFYEGLGFAVIGDVVPDLLMR